MRHAGSARFMGCVCWLTAQHAVSYVKVAGHSLLSCLASGTAAPRDRTAAVQLPSQPQSRLGARCSAAACKRRGHSLGEVCLLGAVELQGQGRNNNNCKSPCQLPVCRAGYAWSMQKHRTRSAANTAVKAGVSNVQPQLLAGCRAIETQSRRSMQRDAVTH